MDESAVFGDTPLADYLSDTGIEDWGIEAPPEVGEPTQQTYGDPQHSARPRWDEGIEPLPLLMNEEGTVMRQIRFRSLLKRALTSKLSHKETNRFLDQFRYAMVSSQLLEARPLYASWSSGSDVRRIDLLYGDAGPWDILRLEPRHYVGGGGLVVVVALLLRWKSASLRERSAELVLVATLLVLLYLFAHSKRRTLRRLRAKALGYIDRFVNAAKTFDGDVVRALRTIQELELIDMGVPSRVRTSKQLRAVLSAALHLATEAILDAIRDCYCMVLPSDFEQYCEIYDLDLEGNQFVINKTCIRFENNSFATPYSGAEACFTPISALKLQFQRVHFLRRVLICCLMTVPSVGHCTITELESWTVVVDQLRSNYELLERLGEQISRERLYQVPPDPPAVASNSAIIKSPAQPLWEIGAAVRHLHARIEILQHESITAEERELYNSQLGAEIGDLQRLWQSYSSRHSLDGSSSVPSLAYTSATSTTSSSANSPDLGDSATILSLEDATIGGVFASGSEASYETLRDEISVFEGVTGKNAPQRSDIPRSERIRLAKLNRAAVATSTSATSNTLMSPQDSFMTELTSVLNRRG